MSRSEYIIFGAGSTGEKAINYLGKDRVKFFLDNNFSDSFMNKLVCNFSSLSDLYDDEIIVVASEKYWKEMLNQLKANGYEKYFVFHEDDVWKINSFLPSFAVHNKWSCMSYDKILGNYQIEKYESIYIYGSNPFLQYLIAEVILQTERGTLKGIVCNNSNDTHNTFLGLMAVTMEEAIANSDCIIVNVDYSDPVREILEAKDYNGKVVDIYDIDKFVPAYAHPELKKYKKIHKGKRCFIVGNGPSLLASDLEVLAKNNEICFGVNKIYKIFDDTTWRPDYLCISDGLVIEEVKDYISDYAEHNIVFMADGYHFTNNSRLTKVQYVHHKHNLYSRDFIPSFSEDVTVQVYWGHSVIYDLCLQLAAFMGFSDIYLIGCDHTFPIAKNFLDASKKAEHFYKEDNDSQVSSIETENWVYSPQVLTQSFFKAEQFSREHGFRIYNATRGGALEVFERVSFDALFD